MKKNIFNPALALVALFLVTSPAFSDSVRLNTVKPCVQGLPLQSTLFELQWAFVDGYIAQHAVDPNDDVRLALKSETQHGVKTWMCAGPQMGWPEAVTDSQFTITFATSDEASTCAQMILDILASEVTSDHS